MENQRKIFLAALVLGALLIVALLLWPRAAERLAPQLKRAWVAIEVADSGVAEVGEVALEPETPFTLHAVLEAEARGGERVYYTQAEHLRIAGREVPAEALRLWNRGGIVKVLWFTVEGAVPYLKLEAGQVLDRFRFNDFLRLDWPLTWEAPGRIDPANDDELQRESGEGPPRFGTQRFQARIEIYDSPQALVPSSRFTSPGAAELEEAPETVSTASVQVRGGAAAASRYFGLTHLDLGPAAAPERVARVLRLTERRLAFGSVPLLRLLIEEAGRSPEDLVWRRVDLAAGPTWGQGAAPGDLVRAGARWVVLYRDAGEPGVLDRQDLCFDFSLAAAVRPLSAVFTGEGDVELARLTAPSAGTPP